MDKLRNIDQLLKNSLEGQEMVTPELSGDWLAIEKRLGQRKNRIYALWFSLALIVVSSMLWFMIEPAGDPLVANEMETVSEQAVVAQEEQSPEEAPQANETSEDYAIAYEEAVSETITNPNPPSTYTTPESTQEVVIDPEPVEPPVTPEEVREELHRAETPIEETVEEEVIVQEEPAVDPQPELPEIPEADEPAEEAIALDKSEDEPAMRSGHWEIGVAFTPAFTDKIMSTNTVLGGLIHRSFRDIVKTSESADLAYNSAVNVGYHWNNGWFLQSGMGLSQRAERVDYDYKITHTVKVDASENRIVEYIPRQPNLHKTVSYSGSNSYHFVEVPLQVGYRWKLSERWEWRNQIGGSYLLLTNSLGQKPDYTYLELAELGELDYLNAHNFSGHLRSGVYYNFKNFVIGAEPMAGVSFNSLNNASSAIQVQPYYYGFNLTTLFKLNGE